MAEIRNDFTWSFSRQQVFESCLRRYYFRYYQFWNGWRRDASRIEQKSYFFSKMQSLPMLIGSGVHETIEELLRSHQSGRPLMQPVQRLRDKLNAAWLDSKRERWREVGPKRAPPLFEHYYGIPVDKPRLEQLRETAHSSLANLLKSDLLREILNARRRWLAIEDLAVMQIGTIPAFVAPDFAFFHGDEAWILDWKTGLKRDDLKLQLLIYALYGHQQWELSLARLRAFDVYLGDPNGSLELDEVSVDRDRLDWAVEQVESRATAMLERLRDPVNNVARQDDFPPTENPHECTYCFFQEICEERHPPVKPDPMTAVTASS